MQFIHLKTEEEVLSLVEYHNRNSRCVVLDTETTGPNPHRDTLVATTLTGYNPTSVVFIQADLAHCLSKLRVMELVLHNFKFDATILHRIGINIFDLGSVYDTLLVDHLLDENNSHALDDIIRREFGDEQAYKKEFWKKYKSFQDAPIEEQINYSCKDIVYTDKLYRKQQELIRSGEISTDLLNHVHKLSRALYQTEKNGLKVDLTYLTEIGSELKPKIDSFRKEMRASVDTYAECVELDLWSEKITKERAKAKTEKAKKWRTLPQEEFNFNSTNQLGRLLYDKLKLPEQFNKESRTVDDAALERLSSKHPLIPMIQEYRTYEKAYTAFIEGTMKHAIGDRVYPSFNVCGTVTGRISSSEPNMQQVPAKGEWAKIRGIYIPEPGYKIITCDYSQLEVVIAAHYSQDKNLLRIINEGASKHDITAEALKIARNDAKTVNFAMQYGCTPMKIASILKCSDKAAEKAWNAYWEAYAGEKAVVDECARKVDAGEPIVNPFGRKRRFPLKFEKPWHRQGAHRQAYSSLIQGTGADCTNWAAYTVNERLEDFGRLLFTVHDELIIMAKEDSCGRASKILQETMIEAGVVAKLTVPLSVECSEPLDRWQK